MPIYRQKERYKDIAIIGGAIALITVIIFILAFVRKGMFLYNEIGSPSLQEILTTVENREEFVALLQNKIAEQGYDVYLSIPEGECEDEDCVKVEWKYMRRFAVSLIEQQDDMMSALRKLGIKKVILSNGEDSWDVFP
ncbi:MAG: hypothetical protein FJ264_08755 [Planctomycetes bacterium]|nr:hypothetical protein [Planctomycetota bacterium]